MVLGGSFRVLVHVEFDRGHAGAQDAVGVDVRVAECEAAERALQLVERKTGVDERAERHVAGDAGETVEVENTGYQLVFRASLSSRRNHEDTKARGSAGSP